MQTYWESEAPENSYYIKYSLESTIEGYQEIEFWTDEPEEFKRKLGFIERHIAGYKLLDKREPNEVSSCRT